ncbi:hypothetical protein HK096_008686, partial [Nowakowskiella sp. JEL0078]
MAQRNIRRETSSKDLKVTPAHVNSLKRQDLLLSSYSNNQPLEIDLMDENQIFKSRPKVVDDRRSFSSSSATYASNDFLRFPSENSISFANSLTKDNASHNYPTSLNSPQNLSFESSNSPSHSDKYFDVATHNDSFSEQITELSQNSQFSKVGGMMGYSGSILKESTFMERIPSNFSTEHSSGMILRDGSNQTTVLTDTLFSPGIEEIPRDYHRSETDPLYSTSKLFYVENVHPQPQSILSQNAGTYKNANEINVSALITKIQALESQVLSLRRYVVTIAITEQKKIDQAVLLIQKVYRGNQIRKCFRKMLIKSSQPICQTEESIYLPILATPYMLSRRSIAAVKIQAWFRGTITLCYRRGYSTRKKMGPYIRYFLERIASHSTSIRKLNSRLEFVYFEARSLARKLETREEKFNILCTQIDKLEKDRGIIGLQELNFSSRNSDSNIQSDKLEDILNEVQTDVNELKSWRSIISSKEQEIKAAKIIQCWWRIVNEKNSKFNVKNENSEDVDMYDTDYHSAKSSPNQTQTEIELQVENYSSMPNILLPLQSDEEDMKLEEQVKEKPKKKMVYVAAKVSSRRETHLDPGRVLVERSLPRFGIASKRGIPTEIQDKGTEKKKRKALKALVSN